MSAVQPIRRYLTNFDSTRAGHILTDILVVGGGVAGLTAAIEVANSADVIVITKGRLEDSATHRAQGGIAAALTPDDSVEDHIRDTLKVGAGLNRLAAVELTCRQGPKQIRQLMADGLAFDLAGEGQRVAMGLEAGHGTSRVLHAGGDATGKELSEFLVAKLRSCESARIFENCFLIDLLTVAGACVGAVTFHPTYGHQLIWAGRTVLAGGGVGQLYRETSNPPGATGDAMAAAFRAGAKICDMELMQFHPTALYIAGSSRALISEAVRGEGAYLVDKNGRRFMDQYHPDGELAPRDVVSRAIVDFVKATDTTSVYLDVRHFDRREFAKRFPTITTRCRDFGIDVSKDLIPVRPAAHFAIGGVVTDLSARTSLPGLFCCGEASCTGLHGANRLASNSLLEGLVFGRIAGANAAEEVRRDPGLTGPARIHSETPLSPKTTLDLADVRQSLRSVVWHNVGIIRHGERLTETVEIVDFWSRFVLDKTFDEPAGWEVQNMLMLAGLTAASALIRAESRGVHFRSDCPDKVSDEFAGHVVYANQNGQPTETWVDLDFT